MQITVNVAVMRGRDILQEFSHTVQTSDQVITLKQYIFTQYGYPVVSQNIHCNASIMEDSQTFADYGVQNGDQLYCLLVGAY